LGFGDGWRKSAPSPNRAPGCRNATPARGEPEAAKSTANRAAFCLSLDAAKFLRRAN
jgi:hypothetical protein